MPKPKKLYSCPRCAFKTGHKSHYQDHLNRKKPCVSTPITGNTIEESKTAYLGSHPGVPGAYQGAYPGVPGAHPEVFDQSSATPSFKCRLCYYVCLNSRGLSLHNRQCQGISPLQCKKCLNIFSCPRNRRRHMKICKIDINAITEPSSEESSNPNITSITTTGNNNVITHNTQNNITQNNFILNGVGDENTDHLKEMFSNGNKLFSLLGNFKNGLCQYLMLKHFDDKFKENQNLRKMNKKDEYIEAYKNGQWDPYHYEDILKEVFENIARDYETFIQNIFEKNGKINRVALDRFMREIGEALEIDVTGDDYDWSYTKSEEEKKTEKTRLYKLACLYIFKKSQGMPAPT